MSDKQFEYGKVREFWNGRASREGELDRRSITFFCEDPETLEFRDRREKDLFDERVELTGEESLLEVGCGSGRWTAFLGER
ncbi:MAG: class I SAM-dependent methyltransferase, partial [Planctomycetota bacterium]